MFQILKKFFTKKPENLTPVDVNRIATDQNNQPPQTNIFNLPPNWQPLDTILDMTPIPGTTQLNVGKIARVIETDGDERIELNQPQGIKGGCNHMMFSIQEIGGTCDWCSLEAIQLFNQGGITKRQAEEYAHFCKNCVSYCFKCFTQRVCSRHTKLFQESTGRVVPLCPNCYEELTHEGGLTKLLRIIFG